MQSRKFNAAALGSALVGLVQMVGGLLILMGYDSATVQNTCNAISVAVGGLFGLVIAGVAHEDAALKKNAPPPVVQQQITEAAQKVGEKIGQQLQTQAQEVLGKAEEVLRTHGERVRAAIEAKLAEALKR